MTTATETAFRTISIEDAATSGASAERRYARLRTELGIQAFGVSAVRSAAAGTEIVPEHDEAGPGSDGHEELYVVLTGHAVFTVAGEEVDAPQGTAVFVGDPQTRRAAVTKQDGTIILAVGGRAGEAFRVTPGELMRGFMQRYDAKDFAGALELAKGVLDTFPGNGLALYNIACMEALLDRPDDALAHLGEAVDAAPRLRENARTDDDFASLRGDERFEELIAD
jgi:hypothetical protein